MHQKMLTPEKIYEVSDYIGRNQFVSRFEIAYLAVDREIINGLMNDKVRFFMKIFMEKQENISLPHLPWIAEYREERFRYGCPMNPSIHHLVNAYKRVTKLKIEASITILLDFLSKTNYLAYGIRDEIFAAKGDNELRIKVFGSIEDIERSLYTSLKSYDALAIPSGDLLDPFVDFYRKYGAEIKETGKYLWNVDLWSGEVSPFIGIPYTDMEEFIPYFGKPRLAAVIEQLWPDKSTQSLPESNGVSIEIDKVVFKR
ncbi:MAG: hypothetical protein U9Q22_01170 [Candidatus Altiarchaeota archaeon]|nr:hypothetical protein [Candidatus Altiarchaeota archaeon]